MAQLPSQASVAIVGAGVVGCSLAFYLARQGAGPVVVLEKGAIGQGATAACAGGVRAQFSTEINIRIGMEAKRVLAGFDQETGRSADYRAIGYLFLLTTAAERDRFHENVGRQRRLGLTDVQELTPAQARELVPGLQVADLSSATFCPSDGLAGPNEVTSGYVAAARRAGVVIMEDTPVLGFLEGDRGIAGVRTPAGEVRSPRTVICAGPWAAQVAALTGLSLPIEPSRRHVFVSERLPAITRRTPMTIDFHTSFYFHPEGDGALFGMSDPHQPPGFDTSVDWSFLDQITTVAARRWPPLLDARVRRAWAGLYEMTPDRQPLVGPLNGRAGLWIAAGFSGHGFMMGPVIGRWLAEWMTRGEPAVDMSPFAAERFDPHPGPPPEGDEGPHPGPPPEGEGDEPKGQGKKSRRSVPETNVV